MALRQVLSSKCCCDRRHQLCCIYVHSTAGEDYTTTSVTLTFQAADASQIVMVPILPDNTFEGTEQFTARLFLPAGQDGVVLGANMASVEMTDDDCE